MNTIPWNKGTKGICKANSGSFKKGHIQITKREATIKTQRKKKENFEKKVIERFNQIKLCPYCGKEFHRGRIERIKQWTIRKFCSQRCGWSSHINTNPERAKYGVGFTRAVKEQIRFRDGYKCQACGCPQVENLERLTIHHIDYNKKNNNHSNLISLCRSCHVRTNGKRDVWTKYFMNKNILIESK